MLSESELAKKDHIQVSIVVALLIEGLIFLQVDDLAEVENSLHDVEVELAKDWMVIVETEMAHVNLDLLVLIATFTLSKFLSNLKETFLNFTLDTWLQLLLHVVELEVLSLEVLQRVAFLFAV